MIEAWDDRYGDEVIALWNESAVQDGYKELTTESFRAIFLNNPYFRAESAFVLLEAGSAIGFACGCTGDDLPLGQAAGYIACVVVATGHQTDDNYGKLTDALENRFRQLGKTQADCWFFNPIRLPWYVPDTPGHEHNNAPGVPVGSRLHRYLLERGYAQRVQQYAMYLPLQGFSVPQDIEDKAAKAEADGYEVALFDPDRHFGVEEMLDALGNPLWRKEIARCAAGGVPVVIAAKAGKAAGFAGPVVREPSGRGYFAGIGVHPEHEGHGLGSVLFFRLCEAFRNIGTEYMSLFTGEGNFAYRIYEKAGFRTARTFAVMRRGL